MIKRMTLLTVLMIGVCVFGGGLQAQQQSPSTRDKQSLITYDGDLTTLLAQIARMYKANIGFETIPFQPRPRIKLNTEFTTIDELLNAIVAADPRYQWRNSDGFIDVYPQKGSCPLLDTMINQYQVTATDWTMSSQILTSLPEVQNQMSQLQLSRKDIPQSWRESTVNVLSVSLKDVTLRRALHEITKASGRGFWMFEQPRQQDRTFSISD